VHGFHRIRGCADYLIKLEHLVLGCRELSFAKHAVPMHLGEPFQFLNQLSGIFPRSAAPSNAEAAPAQPAPKIVKGKDARKLVKKLEGLAQMHRDGVLSEAELTAAKNQMLQLD
jgi:hypothetical protein